MNRLFRSAKTDNNKSDLVISNGISIPYLSSGTIDRKIENVIFNLPPTSGLAMSANSRINLPGTVTSNSSSCVKRSEEPILLQTNVQVCARIRPITVAESKENDSFFKSQPKRRTFLQLPSTRQGRATPSTSSHENKKPEETFVAWDVSEDKTTVTQSSRTQKVLGRTHAYTLDKVFGTDATTQQIYDESVVSLVQAAMKGYHSTVLAYGQTSTGKTYSMTGSRDNPGLIALCMQDCFRYVKESEEPREYLFRMSYLEVYKEHIRDLLSSKSPPEPVRLFDGPNGLVIRGLQEEVVTSTEQVFHLLNHGDRCRQVGATHMNQHSSRSHVMVRLWIESSPSISSGESKKDETRVSSLSLVDLAGSESVRLNGADRREEGQYINKSLMTLGQVVLSLSDACTNKNSAKEQHIPYRDSKLTRLLQPSLSGNSQMLLLCCISPLASHLEESHNTFKFAARAKRIEQKATIQTAQDKDETLLQTYRDEIEDLKQQLAEAKQQKIQLMELQQQQEQSQNVPSASTNAATTMTTPSIIQNGAMESATEEIQELVGAIRNMEQLILKSRPNNQPGESDTVNRKLDDTLASLLESDDEGENQEEEVMLDDRVITRKKHDNEFSDASSSPLNGAEDELHLELARIRGLLGAVLQRRGIVGGPTQAISPDKEELRKSLDFATPPHLPQTPDRSMSEELNISMPFDEQTEIEETKMEVESLRKQVEAYERVTTMRKADSSFLQSQLEVKDKLLEEVSNLLETVERRQVELEKENAALKLEVEAFKVHLSTKS